MKKVRLSLALTCMLLVCAMAVNLTGCVIGIRAQNLMDGIVPNEVEVSEDLGSLNASVTDFAIRLFRASNENGKNTLISPLSVLCALAMTANGAQSETLEQMEEVLGMTTEELNLYLYSYMKNLPQGDKYKLSLANSIWFTDDERFTVNRDFLQTNADHYGTDIYKAPFDKQTLKDINNWVKQNTDEMIPEILDQIPSEAIMYLINAVAFEAEWIKSYESDRVKEGKFTKENGEQTDVEYMHSTESFYLEDDKATGFIKKYSGGKYAFAALLPNEGVSVSEYIASLDGESLNALLANPQCATVHTSIPKFETEYKVEMAEILKGMGMPRAFDADNAEFGDLGTSADGNIYINRVFHKTYIYVGEKGTRAGAATAVEMERLSASNQEETVKQAYLNRPFVYMIIDCENNIPLFIGAIMDLSK